MTIRRSAPRLPQLEVMTACLILSTIAVMTLMACSGPDAPDDSTRGTTTGQAASPVGIAPNGTATARSTDHVGSGDGADPGTPSASLNTDSTAKDTAHQDGDAHDGDHPTISTATVDQAASGDGGNAHVINTTPQITFDPNAITDPIDRNDPAKVAAAYLLARLGCDSHSISLEDCLGQAADLCEPGFGKLLMEKAQNADSWRQQVLNAQLIVTVRIDDIAVQPTGNGYRVTVAYTRTVRSNLVREQATLGAATVTVEPNAAGGWRVAGDSSPSAG